MPAAQAEDASWAVRTAANDFGSGRTSYAYQVDPGTRISDALQVANRGDAPLTLAVYAADGFTGDGGQLDVRKVDEDATGLGAWVTVKQSSITIDPDESVTVPFVLTVPKNATPGDYAGGIVTSLASEDEADQISVDRRLGVSMRLRVGGELLPKLTVDDVEVDHAGSGLLSGSATVTYTLRNRGNATLRTRHQVSVTGPFGRFSRDAGEIDPAPDLLPGESWEMTVPVADVPASTRLTAQVSVTPLAVDAAGTVLPHPEVSATAHTWAMPWWLVLAVVVVALSIAGWIALRRRAAARRRAQEDARVREAVEAALQDVPAGQ